MRASLWLAAASLLAVAGCNLVLDPDGVKPKDQAKPRLGACAKAATGHEVCGGSISAGALPSASAPAGHRAAHGRLDAGAAPRMASPQHQVLFSRITP